LENKFETIQKTFLDKIEGKGKRNKKEKKKEIENVSLARELVNDMKEFEIYLEKSITDLSKSDGN